MKIGIWLESEVNITIGGGASYVNRLVGLIDNYSFSDGIEICYLSTVPQSSLKKDVYEVSLLPLHILKLCGLGKYCGKINRYLIRRIGLERVLRKTGVKVVYYLSQVTCLDPSFPFIATNWDIGHRSTHSFPELIEGGSFENRESYYRNVLPKALMVICESEAGLKEIKQYTNIGVHKIRVMPMFAGQVSALNLSEEKTASVLRHFNLKEERYFFYPAQFWAHKNHYGLVKAFKSYISRNNGYKLVLSGSDKGNLAYIKSVVKELELVDSVLFLGFVSDEEMYALYKKSACLIMASHFGPTNMPPIEAMELGCPVMCSNLEGHHEILGDSAVYFDSYDYNSICDAFSEITQKREEYKKKINQRKTETLFNDRNALNCLNSILKEIVVIRNNWD